MIWCSWCDHRYIPFTRFCVLFYLLSCVPYPTLWRWMDGACIISHRVYHHQPRGNQARGRGQGTEGRPWDGSSLPQENAAYLCSSLQQHHDAFSQVSTHIVTALWPPPPLFLFLFLSFSFSDCLLPCLLYVFPVCMSLFLFLSLSSSVCLSVCGLVVMIHFIHIPSFPSPCFSILFGVRGFLVVSFFVSLLNFDNSVFCSNID